LGEKEKGRAFSSGREGGDHRSGLDLKRERKKKGPGNLRNSSRKKKGRKRMNGYLPPSATVWIVEKKKGKKKKKRKSRTPFLSYAPPRRRIKKRAISPKKKKKKKRGNHTIGPQVKRGETGAFLREREGGKKKRGSPNS